MATVIAYGVVTFFSQVFFCIPVARYWDLTIEGRCLNRTAVWFSHAGLNIFTDLLVIILPLRELSKLQLPSRQKTALLLLFGLGGL
jgi:hypothetical protein